MVLSSVPASVLGSLLLASYGVSLPHTTISNEADILRVPLSAPKSDMSDLVKRQKQAALSLDYRHHGLVMKIKASPDDQEVSLMVDTASSYTWTNPNCRNVSPSHKAYCETLTPYKPKGDPMGKSFSINYWSGKATIEPYSRTLKFGGMEIQNQAFGVATTTEGVFSGILGLGRPPAGSEQYSVLKSMVDQGHIDCRVFSIDVAHNGPPNDNKGSVIFGGIDYKRFSGPLKMLKALPTGTSGYYVRATNIDMKMPMPPPMAWKENYSVLLDTAANHLALPPSVLAFIKQMYFAQVHTNGDLKVHCSSKDFGTDLTFTFDGTKFTTPFANLVGNPMADDPENCFLRLAPSKRDDEITLGKPFFESVYSVFDEDRKQVYLAKAAYCESEIVKLTKNGLEGMSLDGRCQ